MMTQRKDESYTRKRKASEDEFEICNVEAAYEDGTKRLKKDGEKVCEEMLSEAMINAMEQSNVQLLMGSAAAKRQANRMQSEALVGMFVDWGVYGQLEGEITVTLRSFSKNHIDAMVMEENGNEEIFCCALWAIWRERNKRVHVKANRSWKEIANFIKRYISELNGIEEKVPKILTGVRKWKHPLGQFVKINFDAAYDGNLCQSTVGIVARDSEGNVLLSFTEIHHQVASAFAAEAIACQTATQIGIDMQWSNIIIEGDALSITKKCKIKNHDKSMVRAYIQDIHQLLAKSKKYCFEYIPRVENSPAHILAMETLKKKDEIYLVGRVPEYAKNLKEKEKTREPDCR
ncbi:hypothetical protein Gotur_021851 [Gossypium turneri]